MQAKLNGSDKLNALKGIRVVDFSWIHAGPSATRILSDQGAEVIKIESSFAQAVAGGPNPLTPRGVGQRHNWNAGKLSIALNMNTKQGIDIAKRLVSKSDVVAENFSGRVMSKWGMDYESLTKIKPDIIMLSMSGMGRTGPWKEYVSYGQTLQAWSGLTHLTGFPNTDPCGPASAYCDAVGGMAGAQAVLLALIHRSRTGQGQWIDLSQFESLSVLMETLILDLSINPHRRINRTGNRLPHGGGAPHGAYKCNGNDRWVAITVFTDAEWASFREAIGNPSWAFDERFTTTTNRESNSAALDEFVESWTMLHTPEEIMQLLQTVGVAAGVVQSGTDLATKDPHLNNREFFASVLDAEGTTHTIDSAPYKLSRTSGGAKKASPSFGADQTEILQGILNMSDDELAECAIHDVFE